VGKSTSCGRYGRYNHTHCGRCVPCVVRRAAFLKAGLSDPTSSGSYKGQSGQYVFSNLAATAKENRSQDVRAAGYACLKVKGQGIEKFIAGGLSFASPADRARYVKLVSRGLEEIRVLL